jgi:hypothetical protein
MAAVLHVHCSVAESKAALKGAAAVQDCNLFRSADIMSAPGVMTAQLLL